MDREGVCRVELYGFPWTVEETRNDISPLSRSRPQSGVPRRRTEVVNGPSTGTRVIHWRKTKSKGKTFTPIIINIKYPNSLNLLD